jgi:hypothetical protein
MHPEQSLDSVDAAIDLLAAIRSSIGYMLREIPMPLTKLIEEAQTAGIEVRHEAAAE